MRGKDLLMRAVIDEIVRLKPHLADTLRFYEKASMFAEAVKALNMSVRPGQNAYAPAVMNEIFVRFSSYIELPEGSLDPLKRAMELGEIDFTRLPLGETPAFSLPYAEDDLSMLLFIMSRPYFSLLRDASRMDGRTWQQGKCPLCHAQPTLTWKENNGNRLASCSYCGTTGPVNNDGCPICQTVDRAKQNVLVFEGEAEVKIDTCELCRSYVKAVDAGFISRVTPEIADLVSLPIDIVVQERGYARRSPNPIGMRKLSSRG